MARWWHVASVLLGVPGLLLQSYGLVEGSAVVALAGTVPLVDGLALHLKTKGHHPIWGLWGIVPVIGPILVLLQPPKPSMTHEAALDHLLIGEDPHIHYLPAPPTEIVVGRWAPMLVMVPVGLCIILFCAWLPRIVSPGTPEHPVVPETSSEPAPAVEAAPPQEEPVPAPEVESRASAPESENEPPSSATGEDTTSAQRGAATANEKKSDEVAVAEESSVERFKKIRKGMTYEQACEILGRESLPVSGTMGGDRIVKWENPDKSFFAARFHDNILERCTNLNFPPPRKELPEMAVELENLEEKAALARKEAQPPPEEIQAPEAQPEETQDRDLSGEQDQAASENPDPNETAPSELEETGEEPPAETKRVVRIGAENKSRTRPKKIRLPKYSQAISGGTHDVYFHNMNPFPVRVGLRTATKRGKDLTIPPGSISTIFLPNGQYSVYYLNSDEPEVLYNLGALPVDSPLDSLHVRIR